MKLNKFEIKKKLQLYQEVRDLYKKGYTLRQIAEMKGKSINWVWFVVRARGIKLVELYFDDLLKEE